MKIRALIAAAGGAAFVLFACRPAPQQQEPVSRFTDKQLSAMMPADLGPDTVDVSNYPADLKADYPMVQSKCSQCHPFSRVVNSRYIVEGDWTRFVYRMHARSLQSLEQPLFDGAEAKRIIKFLSYDARERKLKKATEFRRELEELDLTFREVEAERAKLQQSQVQEKESAPYVGDKP